VEGVRVPKLQGLVNNAQYTYDFLKANPYNEQSNAKDPVSTVVDEIWSNRFQRGVDKARKEIMTTKKQIRINSINNSSSSLPKPIGKDMNQDYVGLADREKTLKVVQYVVIGYFLYWMFIR
jgi:hypothetical protein